MAGDINAVISTIYELGTELEAAGAATASLGKLRELASTLAAMGNLQAMPTYVIELEGQLVAVCDISTEQTRVSLLVSMLQASPAIEVDIKKIVELSGSPGLSSGIDATPVLYICLIVQRR
jgi:hypothetical protein